MAVAISGLKLNSYIGGARLVKEIKDELALIKEGKGDLAKTAEKLAGVVRKVNEDVKIVQQAVREKLPIAKAAYKAYSSHKEQVKDLSRQIKELQANGSETRWKAPLLTTATLVAALAGVFFLMPSSSAVAPAFTPTVSPSSQDVTRPPTIFITSSDLTQPPTYAPTPAPMQASPSVNLQESYAKNHTLLLDHWKISTDVLNELPFNKTADNKFWRTWQVQQGDLTTKPLEKYFQYQKENGYFKMPEEAELKRLYGANSDLFSDDARLSLYHNLEGSIDLLLNHLKSFATDICVHSMVSSRFRSIARDYVRSRMWNWVGESFLKWMEPRNNPLEYYLAKNAPKAGYDRNATCQLTTEKSKTSSKGYDGVSAVIGGAERALSSGPDLFVNIVTPGWTIATVYRTWMSMVEFIQFNVNHQAIKKNLIGSVVKQSNWKQRDAAQIEYTKQWNGRLWDLFLGAGVALASLASFWSQKAYRM